MGARRRRRLTNGRPWRRLPSDSSHSRCAQHGENGRNGSLSSLRGARSTMPAAGAGSGDVAGAFVGAQSDAELLAVLLRIDGEAIAGGDVPGDDLAVDQQ